MENYVYIIGVTLVLTSAAALIASLVFAVRLITLLSPGTLRTACRILAVFIAFLAGSYFGFLPIAWKSDSEWTALGVPVVFLVVGGFVLTVSILASKTAVFLRRVQHLEQESVTDPLTGLYNRRYLDQRIREETSRGSRHHQPLSVLMIDIDRFKNVNDAYGHQTGDRVLGGVANVVTSIARITDIVARYGGEEIIVMAPNSSVDAAAAFAERIRAAVEATSLIPPEVCGNQQLGPVTVSIGVASTTQGFPDTEMLIKQADEALYRAKEEGRNRVVISTRYPSHSAERR